MTARIELATSAVTAPYSSQLNYATIKDFKVSQPHIGLVTAFAQVRVLGTRVELMSVA